MLHARSKGGRVNDLGIEYDTLICILKHVPDINTLDALCEFILSQHGKLPKHLLSLSRSQNYIKEVARKGYLFLIRWLYEKQGSNAMVKAIINGATSGGHLNIIQYLYHLGVDKWTEDAMDRVALGGHLHILKWCHDNIPVRCSTNGMDGAAQNGHLNVVKWLHEKSAVGCTTWAMDKAALGGHLNVIKWLHEHRKEGCTIWAVTFAAKNGHLEVLRWLYKHKQNIAMLKRYKKRALVSKKEQKHESIKKAVHVEMCNAASTGRLHVLKKLYRYIYYDMREQMDPYIMKHAAVNGQLYVMKWLFTLEIDHAFNVALMEAIRHKQVRAAKYLYLHEKRNNAHWDVGECTNQKTLTTERVINHAKRHGCGAMVEWLYKFV